MKKRKLTYGLGIELVATTRALLGSTELMLFQLRIYEIGAAHWPQITHLLPILHQTCSCLLLLASFFCHKSACPTFLFHLDELIYGDPSIGKLDIKQAKWFYKQKLIYAKKNRINSWLKHEYLREETDKFCRGKLNRTIYMYRGLEEMRGKKETVRVGFSFNHGKPQKSLSTLTEPRHKINKKKKLDIAS